MLGLQEFSEQQLASVMLVSVSCCPAVKNTDNTDQDF